MFWRRICVYFCICLGFSSLWAADDCELPLPSTMSADAYQQLLYEFLAADCYKSWERDKEIRNVGPWILGESYGTHPAIRIYYSPEVYTWLTNNRQGKIANGAIIVKEQYTPPASSVKPGTIPNSWSVMVMDSNGSWDGWFYSTVSTKGPPSPDPSGIDYPAMGFGLYCLNCHASAEKESTYSALVNIEGKQMTYVLVDPPVLTPVGPQQDPHNRRIDVDSGVALEKPRSKPNPAIVDTYGGKTPLKPEDTLKIPGRGLDHVVAGPHGPEMFLTSDQCIGCHDATQSNAAPPNMIYPPDGNADAIVNLSPYGEWSASMMGLAGRDPIFYAQLESELALHPDHATYIQDTCFSCHGVMGKRQLQLDKGQDANFNQEMVFATGSDEDAKYGALARDGISCLVCHHISEKDLGEFSTFTGNFHTGPADKIYGPYHDVIPKPMKNALGIKPVFGEQITTSAMCGSCHTVVLPVLGGCDRKSDNKNAQGQDIFYEQTTYLEWLNSSYQNETKEYNGAIAKSCQDCHMPKDYRPLNAQGYVDLAFRIANIEDETFADVENRLPDKDLHMKVRDEYSRHTLLGINLFGMSMFQQFPEILGISTKDPMATFGNPVSPLITAQEASLRLAQQDSVKVEVTDIQQTKDYLETKVSVRNLVGHHFPSGVGFRRAFIEFKVEDENGNILWISGGTNAAGVILNGDDGEPLPSEFFDMVDGEQAYQPHYQVIERQNQVQIYEELIKNPAGKFTTSFLSLCQKVKDNRLQPLGWKIDGPYAEETKPDGNAEQDCEYVSDKHCASYGKGSPGRDLITYKVPLAKLKEKPAYVSATMYYQSIPPYYLNQRFTDANGPNTQRLYSFVSYLNVDRSAIKDWKLRLQTNTIPVSGE